jgi:ABC-type sugar transport system substrate-binding protein
MFPKKIFFSMSCLIAIFALSISCSKNQKQADVKANESTPQKIIGLLIAGSDACYNTSADVFEARANNAGWLVIRHSSDYKKALEKLYTDEFIASKVDAIAVITTDIITAGECTKKALQAGIPIFYFMTMPQFIDGFRATSVVTIDWYKTGFLNGEYIAKKYPHARCAMIEGGYDQGMTELMRQGFIDGLQSIPGSKAKVTISLSGSWMKPNAMVAMQELLKHKDAFDCIFTGNEEMMLGVVAVLKERNLLGKYHLFSENGREDVGYELIKSGVMEGTAEAVTTKDGDGVFQLIKAYFAGEKIPFHVNNSVRFITKANVETMTPWNAKTYVAAINAGKVFCDFRKLQVVETERKWSKQGNNYSNIYFYK